MFLNYSHYKLFLSICQVFLASVLEIRQELSRHRSQARLNL